MSNIARRDSRVYGGVGSIDRLQQFVRECAEALFVELEQLVSNHEVEILECIHERSDRVDSYVVIPAGLTCSGVPTI